jgi:hypothetical protein
MIIMVKLMKKRTRKMVLVADAGTMVVSKKASSRMANLMVTSEKFLKMALYSKACGSKDGDTDKDQKLPVMVSIEWAHGATTIIQNVPNNER